MSDIDDFSSDDESSNNFLITNKKKQITNLDNHDNVDNSDDDASDIEEQEKDPKNKDNKSEDEKEEIVAEAENESGGSTTPSEKIADEKNEEHDQEKDEKTAKLKKRLAMVNALKKSSHKTGVVYFSSIPPYMKPIKLRQILNKFGEIDRLFLKREDDTKHRQRLKMGGNKKVMYEEGWAEFIRKRDAKLCAHTLNGNNIGGRKGSFYYDDILNVKYLPGFKWADLTEQIARENDIRQAKLELEISQANKLNAEFIRNVEKSKMLENIKKSNKRKHEAGEKGIKNDIETERSHKSFKQNKVATNRANAPNSIKSNEKSKTLGNVLSNL